MSNLLYRNYRRYRLYYSGDDFRYDSTYYSQRACYFADLEPNKTYTIQSIDDGGVFNVGLTVDVLYTIEQTLTSSEPRVLVTERFFKSDRFNPITFTTTDDGIHLVVWYTNNSTFSARAMLNEGDTIEPYEPPH